ncbi:universal stress protein [Nocardia higoensis]|uniref:universal stress protein n=1 Tax=Nocardia higoensis TaxID=228599 RepID=UPI00031C27AE|nr:universal stress protein [Nocardia higoensis]
MAETRENAIEPVIVAAVDGSESSRQAAAWAAAEAALHGSTLHLLTSVAVSTGYGSGLTLPEPELEILQAEGERLVAEVRDEIAKSAPAELKITTEATFDFVIPALLAYSERVRMIVVGSRGLGAFRRGLLGSVSTSVTRHAQCPVTVVHETAAGVAEQWSGKPILVGVDGTENSVEAVEYAFETASRRGVPLIALHSWSDTNSLELGIVDWEAIAADEEALLAERLAGYSERYPDVAVRRVVVANRPVRSLLDTSADAQQVVVGSHGRGGFTGMMLGSTSNALIHTVECPITVIRRR